MRGRRQPGRSPQARRDARWPSTSRPLAVPDGQQPFREVPHAAPDGDRDREGPDADAGDAGQQDEDLERRRRRQDRRDEHRHDPVPAKRGQRAFDAGVAEPLAHQRVAAFAPEVVHDQASGDRSRRRARRVEHEARLVMRHHPDDEQIGDLRQREHGRIEERYEEQAGRARCERERTDLVDDSAHRINA